MYLYIYSYFIFARYGEKHHSIDSTTFIHAVYFLLVTTTHESVGTTAIFKLKGSDYVFATLILVLHFNPQQLDTDLLFVLCTIAE